MNDFFKLADQCAIKYHFTTDIRRTQYQAWTVDVTLDGIRIASAQNPDPEKCFSDAYISLKHYVDYITKEEKVNG